MTTRAPVRVFADPEPACLELEVACQRCGHVAVDDTAPRLRHQRLAGRRYRCAQCGAIGLPTLGTGRLHATLIPMAHPVLRTRKAVTATNAAKNTKFMASPIRNVQKMCVCLKVTWKETEN